MKDNPLKNTNELAPTRVGILAITLVVLAGIALVTGEFAEQVLLIAGLALALLVPLFFLNLWCRRRLLQPVNALRSLLAGPEPPPESAVLEAQTALEAFPLRSAAWAMLFWLVGIGTLVAALALDHRLSGWQILLLLSLGLGGGLVDSLFGHHAAQSDLAQVRAQVEALTGARPGAGQERIRLSRRVAMLQAVVILLALGMSSLVWTGKIREQKARELLADREGAFQSTALALDRWCAQRGGESVTKWKEALEQSELTGKLRRDLLVVSASGDILYQGPGPEADPIWLGRIVRNGVSSWGDLRAPFLYLAHRISGDRTLLWVGSMSLVNEQITTPALLAVLGALLVAVLAGAVAWSAAGLALRPLGTFTARIRQLLPVSRESGALPVAGDEIAALTGVMSEFSSVIGGIVSQGAMAAGDIQGDRSRLHDQLRQFSDASDRRTQLAEQTATSVHQMRSSIQNISEQLESLKEASSDCSSAMFEIDQSVREVTASAENLQTLVDDTVSAMTDITGSMEQVSKNIEELAGAAENTVQSLSVMDASIKQVEESTGETQRLSTEVSEIASRGADSVRQTITGITEIQQVTDEARAVINRLGTQMEAVGKILTVISDVAEQTNLLALNAAIIAAGAGEHGKGFAVVADEIKDLADRTSSSTKEIAGLIKSVQAESRRAVEAMERGTGSVRRGVELSNLAGESLQQILTSVRQAGEMANAIARGTSEHTNISQNINQSMAGVSRMVREIKRAVSEQARNGTRVNRVSEQMREDARFVFRSANEQVQAAGNVARNMERISEMVSFISKAIVEQSQGVGHVAKVAEEVRDNLQQEKAQMADLEEITSRMGEKAQAFQASLEPLGHLMGGDKHERS